MDIILYLTELLQTRKNVGVIGLGTLYKKKSPGKYDATQHAFIPPTYSLAFSTEIKEEEELVNYISAQRNISTESASYYISEFVDQIQAQLAEQHEAALGSLGKLKYVNDELTLVPANENIFGNDFYGLPILPEMGNEPKATNKEEQLEAIEEENKLEEENPGQETPIEEEYISVNDDQPVFDEITEVQPVIADQPIVETAEKTPVLVEEEQEYIEEEPKKGSSIFIKILIVLLVILAAGAIAYFINPKFFDQYLQQNHEGKQTKNVPIVPNDSLKVKLDTSATDSVQQQTTQTKPLIDTLVVDSTKKYYEVIGTSENSKMAADKYIARVAKKGIIAKHFKLSKTRYSVSLGTFINDQQSIKYRDSMRVLLKNPGIYVKIMNPKTTHKK